MQYVRAVRAYICFFLMSLFCKFSHFAVSIVVQNFSYFLRELARLSLVHTIWQSLIIHYTRFMLSIGMTSQ